LDKKRGPSPPIRSIKTHHSPLGKRGAALSQLAEKKGGQLLLVREKGPKGEEGGTKHQDLSARGGGRFIVGGKKRGVCAEDSFWQRGGTLIYREKMDLLA